MNRKIKNRGDEPANPCWDNGNDVCVGHMGLTKREMFAMAAMQNIQLTYNPYESGDF